MRTQGHCLLNKVKDMVYSRDKKEPVIRESKMGKVVPRRRGRGRRIRQR